MSIFSDINPNTTSGNQLATILNSFKDSFANNNAGATRDPNLTTGGTWVDNTSVANTLIMYLYDGTADQEIYRLNTATNIVSFPGGGESFVLTKESDDSLGATLTFLKKRASGSKQTQDGDIVGRFDFKSFSDTSTEEITSQIDVLSEDAATTTVHGSSMAFKTTIEGSGTLTEKMRIHKNGNVGVGEQAPDETLHVKGNTKTAKASDDAVSSKVIIQKSRLASSGQVLQDDVLGEYEFYSTDDSGTIFSAATVKAVATENHTSSNRGTKIVLESVKTGGTTKTVGIEIDGDDVTIAGQVQGGDSKSSTALLDDTSTRNLVTINSANWTSFTVDVKFWGRDNNPETRAQVMTIKGTYDSNASTWYYSSESDLLTGSDDLVTLDFTNGTTLTIDYVNQFNSVNFIEGRIDMDLRRVS